MRNNESFLDCCFYIYDNSPYYQKCPLNNKIVKYVSDIKNGGISKAYNEAALFAKENKYDWLLIADQDTFFPTSALDLYYTALRQHPNIKLFLPKVRVSSNGKYMSPVRKYQYFSKLSKDVNSGIINPSKYAIINSGLLINVDAFFKVGGYNERVWLDFADFQFIEHFSQNYDQAYTIDGECIQEFSNEIPDVNQKINRFKLFCNSIKNYQSMKPLNKFWIGCAVLKRALSLTKQSKNFDALSIFFKNYIR